MLSWGGWHLCHVVALHRGLWVGFVLVLGVCGVLCHWCCFSCLFCIFPTVLPGFSFGCGGKCCLFCCVCVLFSFVCVVLFFVRGSLCFLHRLCLVFFCCSEFCVVVFVVFGFSWWYFGVVGLWFGFSSGLLVWLFLVVVLSGFLSWGFWVSAVAVVLFFGWSVVPLWLLFSVACFWWWWDLVFRVVFLVFFFLVVVVHGVFLFSSRSGRLTRIPQVVFLGVVCSVPVWFSWTVSRLGEVGLSGRVFVFLGVLFVLLLPVVFHLVIVSFVWLFLFVFRSLLFVLFFCLVLCGFLHLVVFLFLLLWLLFRFFSWLLFGYE